MTTAHQRRTNTLKQPRVYEHQSITIKNYLSISACKHASVSVECSIPLYDFSFVDPALTCNSENAAGEPC